MKKFPFVRRLAVIAMLSAASGGALASPVCENEYAFLASLVGSPLYAQILASAQQSYPECFGSTSPTATEQQKIVATSFNQMFAISQNLGSRLLAGGGVTRTARLGDGMGLAAGAPAGGWNAWASYSNDKASYKASNIAVAGAPGTPFNIDNLNKVDNIVVGGDYRIAPTMAVGLSAAFDAGQGYVNPNTTIVGGRTNTSSRGQSIAAYVGWQVNNNWAIDATVGGGIATSKPAPGATAESTRRFAGINLSYANWIGNWQLNGKAGYQFGAEEFDNMRRAVALPLTYYTARLGQARVGGEVGYWLADGVMPYVGLSYVNDLSRNRMRVSQLYDDDAFAFAAGINFFSLKNNVTGGIVYTDEVNRKFVGHGNWMVNINYRF